MVYWAHSDPNGLAPEDAGAHWQRLSEHLENVGAIAGRLAETARPGDESLRAAAEAAGRLHDFGKYTDCFQKMIRTGQGRCQHSAHGAVLAFDAKQVDVAFAIAGHHAGLPDRDGGSGTLLVRVNETREEANSLKERAEIEFPPWGNRGKKGITKDNFDLYTRMLFSCLVDADRLDSSGQQEALSELNAEPRLGELLTHIEKLVAGSQDGAVKKARHQVLEDCLSAAAWPERLLSLTVPTGGGKTLSAMAFALKRAALFPELYRRVIVVIPFLSIIEQNAEVYESVFGRGAILEHHSGSFDRLRQGDEEHFVPESSESEEAGYQPMALRPATENWNAPLIVTTSVRFFESLFSNRPSDLRRVHNIARSIVVLDEVQTLPRRLLAPLLAMIGELSRDWGCTFVFSTATQPAFQKPEGSGTEDARWPTGTIREIVQEPAQLQTTLRRVTIEWELEKTAGWEEIAERLLRHVNALCVVNLREHASALFDAVLARSEERDAVFHLSTRMCAAHRLDALSRIRKRLREALPCRVISTQLIEAGVDLDFDVVYRALGPLDAVCQAAGRADREGRLTAQLGRPGGRLVVFRPEDDKTPPNEYKEATGITDTMAKAALLRGESLQPDSIEDMNRYWNRYYGEGGDQGRRLEERRHASMFRTLADEFEMISDRTQDVFVPYDNFARNAIEELRHIGSLTRELRHELQRYVVGLRPYEVEKARGVLEEVRPDSGIWVLVDKAYTENKGLKFELSSRDMIV